jgi:cardiolipin synthase (CMP-forming)
MAAPTTAGLLAAGHFKIAFGVFAFAGLSDAADGYLAKRFNLVTRFGRILDPIADKALMLAAFLTLALLKDVPEWVAVLVIGRDVLILLALGVALTAQAPIGIHPLFLGKLCAALQVIYVGIHLAGLAFEFSLDAIVPYDGYVLAAVALASTFAYFGVWLKAMRLAWSKGASPS